MIILRCLKIENDIRNEFFVKYIQKECAQKMPKLIKIRQSFDDQHITDITGALRSKLDGSRIKIKPGSNIAVAVGSRGIGNINQIVKEAVEYIKDQGACPFIVPAMGSHGGATAKGQTALLADMGISKESIGVPVISSMDVIELPGSSNMYKLYMDKVSYMSDGVVVINRIKMHTDFRGKTESGLLKMCVIGLGKHKQALEMHRHGIHGLRDLVPQAACEILETGKILFGIGLIENAYDQTAIIEVLTPRNMAQEESRLLDISRKMMPSLPVSEIDILIVDMMGKDISGTGMDTNILGRLRIIGEPEFTSPFIKRVIVSDISPASHGNVLGIGLADFTTKKLFSKIDFASTYENVLTSSFLERGKIPVIAENTKQAFEFAQKSLGITDLSTAKIIRIKNTLNLDELYVSDEIMRMLNGDPNISIADPAKEIFTTEGELDIF